MARQTIEQARRYKRANQKRNKKIIKNFTKAVCIGMYLWDYIYIRKEVSNVEIIEKIISLVKTILELAIAIIAYKAIKKKGK